MKYEHRAIIDSAAREGKLPSELAKELLGHDLLKAMVTAISKPAVTFSKMSEQQQEGVIEDLKKELLPAISTAIGIIVSQNSHAVRMKLKKLATGPSLQLTGSLDKTQDHIHELMDLASDNSDVLVILHERDYVQGLDVVKGEKDQKSLPLEGDDKSAKKPRASASTGSATSAANLAKKATELPSKLLQDARDFITNQQVCTVSGIQNGLKIGAVKATAVLDQMATEGLVEFVGDSKSGEYKLVRTSAPTGKANDSEGSGASNANLAPTGSDLTFDGPEEFEDPEFEEVGSNGDPSILTEELLGKIKAQVLKTKKVSVGALSIAFDADDEIIEQAIQRLELEGVISEENEAGMRTINAAA